MDFNFVRLSGCSELKRKKDKDTRGTNNSGWVGINSPFTLTALDGGGKRTADGRIKLFVSCFAIRKKFFSVLQISFVRKSWKTYWQAPVINIWCSKDFSFPSNATTTGYRISGQSFIFHVQFFSRKSFRLWKNFVFVQIRWFFRASRIN